MTRFIIRAVSALAGFIVGTLVVGIIVGVIGLYGGIAAAAAIAAGLAVGYVGFRIGTGIVERREEGAYVDPGYPPREYDQPYQQRPDQQGYGYRGQPREPYGQYPPYQG